MITTLSKAIDVLKDKQWGNLKGRPISIGAAELLADLVSGTKLSRVIMDRRRKHVTELVTKGAIKIDMRRARSTDGSIPGRIKRDVVIEMGNQMAIAIDFSISNGESA